MGSIFKFSSRAKSSLVIDQDQISVNISVSDNYPFEHAAGNNSSREDFGSINEHQPQICGQINFEPPQRKIRILFIDTDSVNLLSTKQLLEVPSVAQSVQKNTFECNTE